MKSQIKKKNDEIVALLIPILNQIIWNQNLFCCNYEQLSQNNT